MFLGPGLARAFYGVGILRGLAELGLRVESVSGAEFGGLIAGLYGIDGNINDFEWRLLSLKTECLAKVYPSDPRRADVKKTASKWVSRIWNGDKAGRSSIGETECLDEAVGSIIRRAGVRTLSDFKVDTQFLLAEHSLDETISSERFENRWVRTEDYPNEEAHLLLLSNSRVSVFHGESDLIRLSPGTKNSAADPTARWKVDESGGSAAFPPQEPLLWIDVLSSKKTKPKTGNSRIETDRAYSEGLRKTSLRLSQLRSRADYRFSAPDLQSSPGYFDFSRRNEMIFEGKKAVAKWAEGFAQGVESK